MELSAVGPASRVALLVIDMQRDFLDPRGYAAQAGLDIAPLQAAIAPVRRLLDAARAAGMMIVHTREGHVPDLSDCPPYKLARSCNAGAEIGSPDLHDAALRIIAIEGGIFGSVSSSEKVAAELAGGIVA